MATCVQFRRRPVAAVAAALCAAAPFIARAQQAPVEAGSAEQVVVSGKALPAMTGMGGFGDLPLAALPLQATAIDLERLRDIGIARVSDITRLDASINDAYNSDGYWSNLAVRGYALDSRFNYRRDGLPINAETAIALDNKASIEVLKGASGMQAGTSAPGGLVNFVVKRPEATLRSATVGWRQDGSFGAAADLAQRFGDGERFGVRVNAAAERLDPRVDALRGRRHLAALAADWQASADLLVEAEIESSRQSQPSVPGFSLLGNVVPDAHTIDPRTNLNDQPWSTPVVFTGTTASLRLTQQLGADWRATAHAMVQRLRTDDRLAFPFGCSAENNYDRYCSDGTYDLYDYRSDDERRRSDALDLSLAGKARWGGTEHQLSAGVLFTRFESRFGLQAFNYVGTGNIDGTLYTPADPALTTDNTDRDERSTELYLRDAIRFGEHWTAWLGARHTRLTRESVSTSGEEALRYTQSFTTPWVSLSYALSPQQLIYASWGEGVESYVTPNRPDYATPGRPLPAQKSRQIEVGAKGRLQALQWSVAAFDIDRPAVQDTGVDYFIDGSQRHRGLEGQVEGRAAGWQWAASAMWLRARTEGVDDPARDGIRPANVPARNAKLMLGRDIDPLPGLNLQAWLAYEGDRTLLPQQGSPRIGGWTRIDLATRYEQRAGGTRLIWRVGVDNVADRRAWKEAPYQFGHAYLYPLAPRTWRASLQADF